MVGPWGVSSAAYDPTDADRKRTYERRSSASIPSQDVATHCFAHLYCSNQKERMHQNMTQAKRFNLGSKGCRMVRTKNVGLSGKFLVRTMDAKREPWKVEGLSRYQDTTTSGPTISKKRDPKYMQLATVGKEAEIAAMERSIRLLEELGPGNGPAKPLEGFSLEILEEAYKRCGKITAFYAKTFYLGTQLMTPEKQQAIWAIYVWCRRTDELVDGPNASRITPEALDRWEERLESLFEGRPYDILDAALTDTCSKFPLDIQPFKDMIDGMRMDLYKPRYENFDELYEYCYRVAGTVGLMSTPIMGVDPQYTGSLEKVYKAALALGTANQLTNILRDVGEDAKTRNRIYVPKADLESFGISEEEVLTGMFSPSTGKVDDRWRAFMKYQIERARYYFKEAEIGVGALDKDARLPVWSALILYRKILDSIENNDYNNFTTRAYVPKWKKLSSIPAAFVKAGASPKGM